MTKEYIERGALESKAVYMHGFGKNKYVPLKAIQQAQAADVVEVKHGRWTEKEHISYDDMREENVHWFTYVCSMCGDEPMNNTPYCPNCGAKMDGE